MWVRAVLLGLLALTPLAVVSEGEPEGVGLVLNEVLYDPAPGEGEWVELYNAGRTLDVAGFALTDQDGHVYRFPPLVVPPEGYLVLRVGPGVDTAVPGEPATLHMGFALPILNDDGDDLLLEGGGRFLDFLRYGEGPAADPPPPQAPWVGSADLVPEGLSLARIPNGVPEARAADWRPALPTPGRANGSPPASSLLLVEVLTHAPRDDEYVVVANQGPSPARLASWTLSDGEGAWILPNLTLLPGDTLLLARNATALWEDAGLPADACVRGCARLLAVRGSLALRDQGDELRLVDPAGQPVDVFLYGDVAPTEGWVGEPAPALGRGLVARRRSPADGGRDTNTSADWAWERAFRLGQSRRPPASFADVTVKPLLSPDDSRAGLLALLGSARSRIDLAGFTLTNDAVAQGLREALSRGVRVQIGVEASPPGGMGGEGKRVLASLEGAGAQVLLMGSHGEGGWRRYALHHAKYLVVDEAWLVLGSENFSPRGYPAKVGNRGWGVAVHGPALASWFREVIGEDWDANRSDVQSRSGPTGSGAVEDLESGPSPFAPPLPRADVTVLLGPDNAVSEDGLLGVLRRARDRIEVELFYLRWMWGGQTNPLLAGLLEAAARGVTVRILLDGQPYNVRGEEDNDEAVRRLNRLAGEGGLPLEARIFPGDPDGIVKLHNKGLMVDGRRVWVSSMNWNLAGAYANREAGLLVDSPEVARVFQRAWEADWEAGISLDPASPPDAWDGRILLGLGLGSGGAAGAWWWRLRTTKEATNKHPRKARTWRRRSKPPCSPSRRRKSRSTRTAR
ncbi:MAG: phospholipase D-like domain-containing protein [Thermoplasmata archaeon]